MEKEIVLIGGKFHRKRIKVDRDKPVVLIPVSSSLAGYKFSELDFQFEEIKHERYMQVSCIFGEYDIFPKHVYLHHSIDPVEFLKNLVFDYTR